MSEHLDSSGGDEHLSLSPSSPSTDTNQQMSLAEKNLWNLSRKTMLSNAENDREEKEPFAGVNKTPSPSPSRSPSLSPSGSAPDKDLDASSFDPSKLDKSDGSPRSSRDNTPEKRPSSEREGSWERERTPEASPDENRKDKEAPISSSSESSLPESKPGGSTSTTSPAQPSTSASSSSPSDRKRKIELSEEELKIITKRHQKQDEERLKMQVLVSNFSEEQLNRYEMFRRATFPRAAIKRLMQNITATSVSQNVVIAMSGISKVFVGEVLETALDVMEKWGDTGPLHPKHLREAVRILKTKNMIPSTKGRKTLF